MNTIFYYIFLEAFKNFSQKGSTLNPAKSGCAVMWKSTVKL